MSRTEYSQENFAAERGKMYEMVFYDVSDGNSLGITNIDSYIELFRDDASPYALKLVHRDGARTFVSLDTVLGYTVNQVAAPEIASDNTEDNKVISFVADRKTRQATPEEQQ